MRNFRFGFNNIFFILMLGMIAVNNGLLSNPREWLSDTLIIIPGIVIGLALHEFAHAAVAYKLGDNLPKVQGRVTINPMAHIDPIGLVALLFVGFGWGKPVQINPRAFKYPRRDEALVSVAGVVMNFIVAVVFTAVLGLYSNFGGNYLYSQMGDIVFMILLYVIQINVVLMVFNLLPIPPLDGYNLIGEIFNLKRSDLYWKIYDCGTFILLGAILLGVTSRILIPAVNAIMSFLLGFIM